MLGYLQLYMPYYYCLSVGRPIVYPTCLELWVRRCNIGMHSNLEQVYYTLRNRTKPTERRQFGRSIA